MGIPGKPQALSAFRGEGGYQKKDKSNFFQCYNIKLKVLLVVFLLFFFQINYRMETTKSFKNAERDRSMKRKKKNLFIINR